MTIFFCRDSYRVIIILAMIDMVTGPAAGHPLLHRPQMMERLSSPKHGLSTYLAAVLGHRKFSNQAIHGRKYSPERCFHNAVQRL